VSSRRRHTRCLSDWSSDVCSSDLTANVDTLITRAGVANCDHGTACARSFIQSFGKRAFRRPLTADELLPFETVYDAGSTGTGGEIGRASCRERGEVTGGRGIASET